MINAVLYLEKRFMEVDVRRVAAVTYCAGLGGRFPDIPWKVVTLEVDTLGDLR